MKYHLTLSLTAIFWLTLAAFAQENQPENWQYLQPEMDVFSVELPAPPDSYVAEDNSLSNYRLQINGTYYFIFSENEKSNIQILTAQKFLDQYKNIAVQTNTRHFNSLIYSFSDEENFFHSILRLKSKNRILFFHTVSPTKENASVKRFFDSIELANKKSGRSEKRIQPPEKKEPGLPNNLKVENNLAGNGLGSGSGSGVPISAINKKEMTPIKILSKPRAAYSEFARFYNISGNVTLRITFLANGEIGAVNPTAKLPFGLTNNAITAARQIRFEPQTAEGNPISVTKSVQYSFIIY